MQSQQTFVTVRYHCMQAIAYCGSSINNILNRECLHTKFSDNIEPSNAVVGHKSKVMSLDWIYFNAHCSVFSERRKKLSRAQWMKIWGRFELTISPNYQFLKKNLWKFGQKISEWYSENVKKIIITSDKS